MNGPALDTKRGRAALISPTGWRDTWRTGPLAERGFRLLAAGQLTSTVGDYCYAVALPWLVLSAHDGAAALGAVPACYGVPCTVLIPAGGWPTGPGTLMLTADLMRCAVVTALTVLALRGLSSAAALGPPTALLGAGEGLFLPASFAIMPTLLPAGQLAAGNAVSAALVQVGSMAGPVLGGAVVAAAGSAPAFAVDAATFAVSALTLALIRPHRRPSRAAASSAAGQDAGHGVAADPVPGLWALLRRERILQVILVMAVMANLAGAGTFAVALPALAHAEFGAGGYGALIACVGAGTVAGTVGAARGTRLRRPAITACGCLLGFAAATALVPFLGGLPGACAALAVVGAANGFCNVIMITMLQRWAPRRLLGRVMSLVVLAAMGTYPVSVVVTGALIRIAGPRPFFPIAGAAVAAAAVFALAQREVRDFGPARKLSSWGCWRSCRARTAGRSPSTPTRPGLLPRLGPAGRVRRGTGVRHPAGGPAVGHHVALPELAIEFRAVRPGVGHPGDIPGDGSRGSRRGGVAEYLGVAALTARPGDRDAGIGRTRDEGWQAQADQS